MQCSFCPNPAAHPSTGCQYTSNMIACRQCVVDCWSWVRSHTNKRPRKSSKGAGTAMTFYEAAAHMKGIHGS